MAHIKLSHNRAILLRAYPLQTHERLFDALWHGFRAFGGGQVEKTAAIPVIRCRKPCRTFLTLPR